MSQEALVQDSIIYKRVSSKNNYLNLHHILFFYNYLNF